MTEDPMICGCNDVYKIEIAAEIKQKGLRNIEQVENEFYLSTGTYCGACREEVQEIMNEVNGQ